MEAEEDRPVIQDFRRRPRDAGRARGRYVRQRLGEELRIARVSAGMTQADLARVAGVAQSYISAVERGVRSPSIEAACLLAAAVGHDLSVRLFPADGVSLRDSGQLAMSKAIISTAHARWHPYLEMPVTATDRRAADLVLVGQDEVLHVEIERRIVDFQAQFRGATLKREALSTKFAQPVRLVLALPDRRSSRLVLRELGTLLQRTLPIGSSQIRRAISSGGTVGGDGILFWPMPPPGRTQNS